MFYNVFFVTLICNTIFCKFIFILILLYGLHGTGGIIFEMTEIKHFVSFFPAFY